MKDIKMKMLDWFFGKISDEEVDQLENRLLETLVPVKPRTTFVENLRSSLLHQTQEIEIISPRQTFPTSILVASAVLGSIFVLLTGMRGMISMLGVLGLIISWIRHETPEIATSSSKLAH
jgi:hypothetical protein